MMDTLIWQYKDNQPLGLPIDNFVKSEIGLCLIGMEVGKTDIYFHKDKERKEDK